MDIDIYKKQVLLKPEMIRLLMDLCFDTPPQTNTIIAHIAKNVNSIITLLNLWQKQQKPPGWLPGVFLKYRGRRGKCKKVYRSAGSLACVCKFVNQVGVNRRYARAYRYGNWPFCAFPGSFPAGHTYRPGPCTRPFSQLR